MPALNFQKQFAPLVESGEKRQTIRAPRKDGRNPKFGDRLHLYTGMRTRACRKLAERTCTAATNVTIGQSFVRLADRYLTDDECQRFARADGFESMQAMLNWFAETHGLPFSGIVINWSAFSGGEGG